MTANQLTLESLVKARECLERNTRDRHKLTDMQKTIARMMVRGITFTTEVLEKHGVVEQQRIT